MQIQQAPATPISKEQWQAEVPLVRDALLDAQHDLRMAGSSGAIVLLTGVRTAGKSETVHRLTGWLDPRSVHVHALSGPTDEERARPRMWRYWRRLPPKGRIGIFYGGWYNPIFEAVVMNGRPLADLHDRLQELRRFERLLADDGMLLVKLHLQLGKQDQRRRIDALDRKKTTRWRLTKEDWLSYEHHDQMHSCFQEVLQATDGPGTGWTVIDAKEERFRELTAARTLVTALRQHLDKGAAPPGDQPTTGAMQTGPRNEPSTPTTDADQVLSWNVDLSRSLDAKTYDEQLARASGRLALLTRRRSFQRKGAVVVFEGVDAAGKGGAIRRVTSAMDARQYQVVPIAAPSDEERAQPWLWRFWRHVPGHGRLTLYDRSWYGRVLVERIEGFCSEAEWRRAFDEIVEFEQELTAHGLVVVKFWLAISKAEQLRRFEERRDTSYKRIKLTEEDWRNRARFEQYQSAVQEMVERTSTRSAPWTLVAAEDKRFARIQVLTTLADQLGSGRK